jgi:hypothetical protein
VVDRARDRLVADCGGTLLGERSVERGDKAVQEVQVRPATGGIIIARLCASGDRLCEAAAHVPEARASAPDVQTFLDSLKVTGSGKQAEPVAVRHDPDEKPAPAAGTAPAGNGPLGLARAGLGGDPGAGPAAPAGNGPLHVPLNQVNLSPEKYQDQFIIIDRVLLFGVIVGRGGDNELQILFDTNERKPDNLAFPISRELTRKLADQLRPQNYSVMLTCKIEKVGSGWQARVYQIQFLGADRRVFKTVE